MNKFQFTLSRMLTYKEQTEQLEKNALARLNIKKNEIEDHIELVENEIKKLSKEFFKASQEGTTALKLRNYNYALENNRFYIHQLNNELAETIAEVEKQLKVVLAITQEVEGLQKLKEKQYEEYQYEEAKAQALVVSEFVASKLVRDKKDAQEDENRQT